MATKAFSLKRGGTFRRICVYRDSITQEPLNLTDVTLTAQLRQNDRTVVATATITKSDQTVNTGQFELDFGNSSNWPLGVLFFDIKRVFTGIGTDTITHSETVVMNVLQEQTR